MKTLEVVMRCFKFKTDFKGEGLSDDVCWCCVCKWTGKVWICHINTEGMKAKPMVNSSRLIYKTILGPVVT